jgi:hypothetical protein
MRNLHNLPHVTFEQLLDFHYENVRFFKEQSVEFDRERKESERYLREMFAESDRQRRESDAKFEKYREDYEKRQKKIDELLGSWDNNHGAFAEEYFFNAFEAGKQDFFGEKFDDIERNAKGLKKGFKDEYDILLINGKSIGIIEVKFKAHDEDIPKYLRKAETFRVNFPDYKNHQIYIGLASMSYYPLLEEKCKAHGIAIIKQVGDKVVIWDENLRAY